MTRIEEEQMTVERMLTIYCRHHHNTSDHLCPECSALRDYAFVRLSRCHFGEHKPTCRKCPIHCYKPTMKAQMQAVMRYAGPRMLWHHPLAALRHILRECLPSLH